MKDEKNEFLGLLCNLYLVVLLVALPLYTGNGYWQLGDTKYTLFRNLSFLCLGGWLLAGMPGRVRDVVEYFRRRNVRYRDCKNTILYAETTGNEVVRPEGLARKAAERKQKGSRGAGGKQAVFSGMDFAMMSYGICVVLSAVCSAYGRLAWVGYEGWYMGAISQFLFIGIYFFVSRQYDGAVWPVYLGEAAFFLVTLLGLLHRLGIDPLGLMGSWSSGDWEYSHMLSTLGNINWLCGYYSVALAFVIAHFLREKRRWLQAVLYLVSMSAFVLLLIQGSQSGLLILGACVAVCFFMGRRQSGIWGKVLLLLSGTSFFMPVMEMLMKLRGSKAAIVADGNIFAFTSRYGWGLAAVICIFLFLLLEKKGGGSHEGEPAGEKEKQETIPVKELRQSVSAKRAQKTLPLIALTAFAAVAVLAGLLFWRRLDDSFGSGRGFLWRIAAESFMEADVKGKLLGAGPDCYGEAVFNRLGAHTDVWKGEHWEGAVFTNAHNEILSQLCNVGILGTVSYLAVFLAGMRRYGRGSGERHLRESVWREDGAGTGLEASEKRYRQRQGSLPEFCLGGIGLLALAMYGIHSLVSFQQVLNAPLLFLTLGLCEAEKRKKVMPEGTGDKRCEKGSADSRREESSGGNCT